MAIGSVASTNIPQPQPTAPPEQAIAVTKAGGNTDNSSDSPAPVPQAAAAKPAMNNTGQSLGTIINITA